MEMIIFKLLNCNASYCCTNRHAFLGWMDCLAIRTHKSHIRASEFDSQPLVLIPLDNKGRSWEVAVVVQALGPPLWEIWIASKILALAPR